MQEFHDQRMREIKILADFDINTEREFLGMGIDDFYFHVWAKKDHGNG